MARYIKTGIKGDKEKKCSASKTPSEVFQLRFSDSESEAKVESTLKGLMMRKISVHF